MATLAQFVVLGSKDTLDSTHQGTTLAGKVRVYFVLEGRFKQVTGTNANTHGNNPILGTASSILVDGVA